MLTLLQVRFTRGRRPRKRARNTSREWCISHKVRHAFDAFYGRWFYKHDVILYVALGRYFVFYQRTNSRIRRTAEASKHIVSFGFFPGWNCRSKIRWFFVYSNTTDCKPSSIMNREQCRIIIIIIVIKNAHTMTVVPHYRDESTKTIAYNADKYEITKRSGDVYHT